MLKKIIPFSLLLISLMLPTASLAALPGFLQARLGTMTGSIHINNKPVPHAIVAFFDTSKGLPPTGDGMMRLPDFMCRANNEGDFSCNILGAEYYIGVLPRTADQELGPPNPGETFYFANDGHDNLRKIVIKHKEQLGVGRIDASPAEVFSPETSTEYFTVEGRTLTGETEQPFPKAIILARNRPTQGRPDFFSKPSGEDGSFSLKLPADNRYYLLARSAVNGIKPQPGDKIGSLGINTANGLASSGLDASPGEKTPPEAAGALGQSEKEQATAISGKKGEVIRGLVIRMFDVPDRQSLQEKAQREAGMPGEEDSYFFNNITFDFNSTTLSPTAKSELRRWVDILSKRSDVKIILKGHTDDIGDQVYNQKLSELRAKKVADYLISQGMDKSRISIKGYGPSEPAVLNITDESRGLNRRVEIQIETPLQN